MKKAVLVRLEADQAEALRELARRLDRLQSRLLREAVSDLLRKYEVPA